MDVVRLRVAGATRKIAAAVTVEGGPGQVLYIYVNVHETCVIYVNVHETCVIYVNVPRQPARRGILGYSPWTLRVHTVLQRKTPDPHPEIRYKR